MDLGKDVKLELVLIPAGEFLMGSPDSDKDADADEKPQHKVRITRPFYLGKYLVTQEQWEAVMRNNPSHFKGPKNPVEKVSWDDCQQFLDKLNKRQGNPADKFVLPTEAQWEYACRAGSTTRYCFGDDESKLGEYAWYDKNSDEKAHPVGEKKPNAWGLYDMHGSVWEWCQDWYGDGYYKESPVDDPTGPATGSRRALRGGSWLFPAWFCRLANRGRAGPVFRYYFLGLRVSPSSGGQVERAEPERGPQRRRVTSRSRASTGGASNRHAPRRRATDPGDTKTKASSRSILARSGRAWSSRCRIALIRRRNSMSLGPSTTTSS